MEEIKAKLMAKYEMRDLHVGELHWFPNVKICGQVATKTLALSI